MSLQLIFGGERQIVVAADSRQTNPGRVGDPFSDGHTKLFRAGERTAVAIGGLIEHDHAGPYATEQIISRICGDKGLADSPRRLLEAIAAALHPFYRRICSEDPITGRWVMQHIPGATVFIALAGTVTPSGTVELLELRIPVVKRWCLLYRAGDPVIIQHLDGTQPLAPFLFSIGLIAASQVGEVNGVYPDQADAVVAAQVEQTFGDACAKFDTEHHVVGGALDIAAISPATGFRWLRHQGNFEKALPGLALRASRKQGV